MLDKRENISLKELLAHIKAWLRYLIRKWHLIVIPAFIAALAGFFYASTKKPTYTAEVTFVLSSGQQSGGALSSLAGQLGYNTGNNDNGIFEGDNITELFKSNRIIKAVLFRKTPDSSATLLSMLIKENKDSSRWQKNTYLQKILPFPSRQNETTPLQDSILVEMRNTIITKYLYVDKPNKKLSVYSLRLNSTNKDISYYLAKFLLDEASKFYIDTKTKTARQNLNMLQHEADSISNLLSGSIQNTAAAIDQTFNLNPAYQVKRTTAQRGQANIAVLNAAYGEVVRNLELAKITLQKETPLYQVVDEPIRFLKLEKKSRLLTSLLYGFVVACCAIVYLLIKKYITGTNVNKPQITD